MTSERKQKAPHFSVDLLRFRTVRSIMASHFFPYGLQVFTLLVFFVLVTIGLRAGMVESEFKNFYLTFRKTNLATLVVWGLWWPGLVVATVLLGRVWCTVCPMELVSNVARRAARGLGLRGLNLPRWIRGGYIILLLYIILQLSVAGFHVHRVPYYTAFVLLGMFSLALLVGVLFRRPRAFCEGFCPAALLLDVYSRLTRLQLRNSSQEVCDKCETKDCVREENRQRWDVRNCPSYLRPYDLHIGDGCVLCFQCHKICAHDNIDFGLLKSEVKKRMLKPLSLAAALFVFIASGFVAHELFSEVKPLNNIFHTVPNWLTSLVGAPNAFGWFEAAWFLGLLPFSLALVLWGLSWTHKSGLPFSKFLIQTAELLIPVVAAGHAAKALIKMNSWGSYLPEALQHPIGTVKALLIVSGQTPAYGSIFPATVVAVVTGLLLVGAVLWSLRLSLFIEVARSRVPAFIGTVFLFVLYISVPVSLVL